MKRLIEILIGWLIILIPLFVWVYSDGGGMLSLLIVILVAPCLYFGILVIRKGIKL